jgi:uncharacterized protein YggU (UPF0235/DUF167 family)
MPVGGFFRLRPEGLDLFVRLTPKSATNAVEGIGMSADGTSHLKARVRAVPENGAANAALEKLLAAWLALPKRDVKMITGGTSRLKTVRVSGDAAMLAERVELLAGH